MGKGSQTITPTSTAPAGATFGGATYTPTATASSGLTVAITIDASSSAVCSISAGVVSYQAAGTCTSTSTRPATPTTPPHPGPADLHRGPRPPRPSRSPRRPRGARWAGRPTRRRPRPPRADRGHHRRRLVVGVQSTAGCVSSSVGTCTLDVNQAGNANYNAAPRSSSPSPWARPDHHPTSTAPAGHGGRATYTPTATASSGLAVAITIDASSSSVCSIAAGAVSFQTAGTCVVDFNQAGNANYDAAPRSSRPSRSGKGSQTITPTSTAPAATVGGATYTPTATASSGLAVAITIDASLDLGVLDHRRCRELPGGRHLRRRLQPGRQRQLQRRAPGPADLRGGQGLPDHHADLHRPVRRTVGGATYTPTATASSGLAVAITIDASSSAVLLDHRRRRELPGRRHLHRRLQPGRQRQLPAAAQVQQSFTVGKGSQTITPPPPPRRPRSAGPPTRPRPPPPRAWPWPSPSTPPRPPGAASSPGPWSASPDGRHLHRRLQPGRQRQLHGRPPGPADLHRGQGLPDHHAHLDGTRPAPPWAGPPTRRRPRPPRA